jgi:hypothetical protein
MGISSLMGYKDGGDADAKKDTFDTSFDKYQSRLSALRTPSQPVSFYDVASKLGAGLLAQQAEKFPSIGRGLGLGFQSLSEEIAKRREQKRKEEEAVAMKAMELAITDERQAEKYLNDYALKMIDMANKDIKTITLDTSMLVGAVGPDGEPLLNTQTGVAFRDETTLKANDPYVSELLGLGAVAKDRAGVTINQQGGNELDKRRAANIADAEAKWQEEADAATALRDQISIARGIAEELGERNFGTVDAATLGLKKFILDLGFEGLVDKKIIERQEELQQNSIGFVMALVGKTKGAISNREMDIFFAASPTLATTYGGYMNMLNYMDRIAELTEKYNEEWQAKQLELENKTISEINAEFAKFKREFKQKPENKLFQTDAERQQLESIADKDTYNQVNSNYLRIQRQVQDQQQQDSMAKLRTDIMTEMADANTTAERKKELQNLLDQMGE